MRNTFKLFKFVLSILFHLSQTHTDTHIQRESHHQKCRAERGMWPVISAQESRDGYMLLSEKAEGGRKVGRKGEREHRRKK